MEIGPTTQKLNNNLQETVDGKDVAVGKETPKHASGVMGVNQEAPEVDETETYLEAIKLAPDSGLMEEPGFERNKRLKLYERIANSDPKSKSFFTTEDTNNNGKSKPPSEDSNTSNIPEPRTAGLRSETQGSGNPSSYLTPDAAALLLVELGIEFSIRQRRESREFARQEREVRIFLMKDAAQTFRDEATKLRTSAGTQLALGCVAGAISIGMGTAGIRAGMKSATATSDMRKMDNQIDDLTGSKPGQSSSSNRDKLALKHQEQTQDLRQNQSFEQSLFNRRPPQKQEMFKKELQLKAGHSQERRNLKTKQEHENAQLKQLEDNKAKLQAEQLAQEGKMRAYTDIGQGMSQVVSSFSGFATSWIEAERKLIEAEREEIRADAEYADANDKEALDFAQRMQEHAANMSDHMTRYLQSTVIKIHA